MAEAVGRSLGETAEQVQARGRLIAIARRSERRAPMQLLSTGMVTVARGLEGDHKGPKFPKRQITVLAIEDWRAALADLNASAEHVADLPWTARRANLLVEGVRLPRVRGAALRVGEVELVVEAQLLPCGRMDASCEGLRRSLHPNWRGGLACSVALGGVIELGDEVVITHHPAETTRRLP